MIRAMRSSLDMDFRGGISTRCHGRNEKLRLHPSTVIVESHPLWNAQNQTTKSLGHKEVKDQFPIFFVSLSLGGSFLVCRGEPFPIFVYGQSRGSPRARMKNDSSFTLRTRASLASNPARGAFPEKPIIPSLRQDFSAEQEAFLSSLSKELDSE